MESNSDKLLVKGFCSYFELLIAQVSKDPLVLGKLLGTLRPGRLVLFVTPEARRKGWEDRARQVTRLCANTAVEWYSLPSPEHGVPEELAQKLAGNSRAQPRGVAVDVTTGRGLDRVLLVEVARKLFDRVSVVYCTSPPSRVELMPLDGRFRQSWLAVEFPFGEDVGSWLAQRLKPYGVEPKWNDRLRLTDRQREAFRESICTNAEFRSWLHSGSERAQQRRDDWGQQVTALEPLLRKRVEEYFSKLFSPLLPRRKARVAAEATQLRDGYEERLVAALLQCAQDAVTFLPAWKEHVQPLLKQEIRMAAHQRLEAIFSKKRLILEWRSHARETDDWLYQEARQLICGEPIHLLVAREASSELVPLLEENSLADLFEQWVACEVEHLVRQEAALREKVQEVASRVEVVSETSVVMELDVLVLLRTGDLLHLECKTHYHSGNQAQGSFLKDIKSRVKALEDYTGAYSEFSIVFPLTEEDIRQLKAHDEKSLRAKKFAKPSDWWNTLERLEEEGVDIVPVDRLREKLEEFVRRHTG